VRNFSAEFSVTLNGQTLSTPESQLERDLVAAAQADPEHFLELYDRYFHRVWAYVIGRARNRADAEDVTSEVFRRALENLVGYEWRGAPFFAWLQRIAANILSDRWQTTGRESVDPPPETTGRDIDLEQRVILFQLVDRLPEAQRRVIELKYLEERSLLEIARTLGRTEGAVKQLQRRALEHLREEWEAGHA
jgi:RNA polymerase sigma-70 factor (ECF subfamily)